MRFEIYEFCSNLRLYRNIISKEKERKNQQKIFHFKWISDILQNNFYLTGDGEGTD